MAIAAQPWILTVWNSHLVTSTSSPVCWKLWFYVVVVFFLNTIWISTFTLCSYLQNVKAVKIGHQAKYRCETSSTILASVSVSSPVYITTVTFFILKESNSHPCSTGDPSSRQNGRSGVFCNINCCKLQQILYFDCKLNTSLLHQRQS